MTAKKYNHVLFYGALLLLILMICNGEETANAARDALMLCARSLIPALLAPLVISGILSAASASVDFPFNRVFSRLFRLPPSGISPFLLGALCGFPIGAKVTAELYEEGLYGKNEAARIAALSANTGPAFAVAAVGIGFFGSGRVGWLLYLTQLLSAIILGLFDAKRHPLPHTERIKICNPIKFSLSDILYRSSISLLTITGTVAFFGALCALPSQFLPKNVTAALCTLLEVGNGTHQASMLPQGAGIPLAAFSISFSGISVLLQNAAHLVPQGIPITPLIYRKLLQGILAMLLAFLLYPLLQ